jgi:APA family basic amino acid/polyamine antiporter
LSCKKEGKGKVDSNLNKKYGLITAIAMVVGIVIGSGVFFKAEKVLVATGGNLPLGIMSWIIGGAIMVVCAYTFSIMATRYEYINGIVDYAEVSMGKKYSYYLGWFMSTTYYPTLTAALAWVSARYTCVLLSFSIVGPEALAITGFYLVLSYALNALSPVLAGKFQVTTTMIKLVPLFLMGVIGTIVGLVNGMTFENFTTITKQVSTGNAMFTAVVATAFAYEGWIIATSINAELKNSKENLPKALVIGAFIVVVTYILYYIGLSGAVSNAALMESGEKGAKLAFETIFSKVSGTALFVFVVISCLGTLNGLMLGCTRGIYALAARDMGPVPDVYKQVDKATNMSTNSAILGLLFCGIWLLYFYGSQLTKSWFGFFNFDITELPIITIYAAYIPIFLMLIKKEKDLGVFKRYIAPILAICSCIFMIIAACFSHKIEVLWYLIVFAVIITIGKLFDKSRSKQ